MAETETISTEVTKPVKKDMSWKSFFIFLVFIVLFRLFVLEPHNVSGSSMDNTFKDGDYVLVDKISYRFTNPKAGDVVVFDPPAGAENTSRFIKRIIATPGKTVEVKEDGTYIDQQKTLENFIDYPSQKTSASLLLKTDEYFVMGDNRYVSYDSRYWGPIVKNEIQGRVLVRLYPFNKIGFFPGEKEYTENK
jgi:signal peptidase I